MQMLQDDSFVGNESFPLIQKCIVYQQHATTLNVTQRTLFILR